VAGRTFPGPQGRMVLNDARGSAGVYAGAERKAAKIRRVVLPCLAARHDGFRDRFF